jgi:NSS family neurotransmitter:Na+ symporter
LIATVAVNIWLRVPRPLEGHREVLLVGDAGHGGLRHDRARRVLTLGTRTRPLPEQNVLNGLGYMWNPDFEALANPQTWLAAAGQIFFSLSVGFGVIINYASYMRRKDDVVLSGLTASATNELFEVGFGGMITLTAAFVFLGASNMAGAVPGGTFGLGFTTLPVVFAHMPLGNIIGAIWFFMLFLAAITSSLSMLPAGARLLPGGPRGGRASRRRRLIVGISPRRLLPGDVLQQGRSVLGTIDDWVGTFLIFVLARCRSSASRGSSASTAAWDEAHEGAQMRIPASTSSS